MMELFRGLFIEEEGQGMTEYGLILGLIAVAAIVTLGALGGSINDLFDGLSGKFPAIGA